MRPPKNTQSCQANSVSTYSEGYHHPPCLPSYNHPAAVSQTYRSSGWEATELFISSLFQGHVGSTLPTGWVALLPGSQIHEKIFSFAVLVLVLLKRTQLHFYNWLHGWITKPPLKGLVVKHCHYVNSSVLFRPVKWTPKMMWNNNAYISN